MISNIRSKRRETDVHKTTLTGAILIVLGLFAFPIPSLIEAVPSSFASEVNVLQVPRDFVTIQAAVDAANPGDIINVAAGVYNENVVIVTSGLRLHASSGAMIDGNGLTGMQERFKLHAGRIEFSAERGMGFEIRGFLPAPALA